MMVRSLGRLRKFSIYIVVASIFLTIDTGFAQVIDLPKFLGFDKTVDDAVNAFNGSLEKARSAVFALEYQINKHAMSRIAQVQGVVDEAITRVDRLQAKTSANIERILSEETAKVNDLEHKAMEDLGKIIKDVECASNRQINQSIPDLLGQVGRLIGTNTIEVSAPILYDGEKEPFFCGNDTCRLSKQFAIKTPFSSTYREIRNYLLDRIDLARDDTPRYTIVITYAVLAQFAKRTSCFFPGTETEYLNDYEYYVNKARAWDIIPETRR